MPTNYNDLRDALKQGFERGACSSLTFRRAQLVALVAMLEDHKDEAVAALASDMGRPAAEAGGEVAVSIREAKDAASSLERWSAPEPKPVHLMMQPSHAAVRRSPYGACLIIGPYNYPLMLCLEPLIGAIAAGNATLLKPSELTPATAAFLEKRIPAYLTAEACRVVTGGVEVSQALLATQWDFIYFTGSPRVGRIVAKAAAEHLTPTALELGGKAPAVVLSSADVGEAARRIVNAKALNVGQTCIAPDYVLVDRSQHTALVAALTAEMRAMFGDEPHASPDLGRMCTVGHFDRMAKLLAESGGTQRRVGSAPPDREGKYMPLTLIDSPPSGSPLLREEIFGPLLPVVTFDSFDEAVETIRGIDSTPLALYVFTADTAAAESLLQRVQSGTAVVNDCVLQHMCHSLPFGGVGTSGHGVCHGEWSFQTFTFPRSVLWRHAKFDVDQTVPVPARHAAASGGGARRAKLLEALILHGPYLSLPGGRSLLLLLAGAAAFVASPYLALAALAGAGTVVVAGR